MNYVAEYDGKKLETIAFIVKTIVDADIERFDVQIATQTVKVAIRKLHDVAVSKRGTGKYKGHPVWSKRAVEIVEEYGNLSKAVKFLRHEHLIPLNIVVPEIIFKNPVGLPIEVYKNQILKYAAIAIITREEDKLLDETGFSKTMPSDWDGEDVFIRYKLAGLYDSLESIA